MPTREIEVRPKHSSRFCLLLASSSKRSQVQFNGCTVATQRADGNTLSCPALKIEFWHGAKLRFIKYHYSLTNTMGIIGNWLDSVLASCSNALNTIQALRTVAIFAMAVQCMTLHTSISKVTNHIIHIIEEGLVPLNHQRVPNAKRLDSANKQRVQLSISIYLRRYTFKKIHELMAGLISAFNE